MSVWKSDETLLSICILNFSFKNDFVWEEISNIRHSVSSPDETLHLMFDILHQRSYSIYADSFSSRKKLCKWKKASAVRVKCSITDVQALGTFHFLSPQRMMGFRTGGFGFSLQRSRQIWTLGQIFQRCQKNLRVWISVIFRGCG